MAANSHYEQVTERLKDITNLERAGAVLSWDQQTYMPPGGSEARGEQMATLGKLAHELFTADETGALLEAAAAELQDLPYDSDEASLLRVTRRDFDRYRKLPREFVAEMIRHSTVAYNVWTQARAEDNYSLFAPCLERTIELARQGAEYIGYEDQPYDALLEQFEPGMTTRQVQEMFAVVRAELVPLVEAIAQSGGPVDDSMMRGDFPEAAQEEFGLKVAATFGYDLSRGRQDRTVHPFETSFSINDVRITTAFEPHYLPAALFSTMHEAGHAMYEQGIAMDLDGTPLAHGTSLSIHESQSRLWENVIGRSLPFWQHFYPQLQALFPSQLGDVPLHSFHRAINQVQPSLIRIDADEVTYNLHIMLRLEMELAFLSGDLSVQDAPAAWNDKMEAYLGLRPPTNREGILQDVHWSSGILGYFPTYSLGNFLSIQLYDTALQAHPNILDEIEQGRFDTLRGWLTENVYRYGRKFMPGELIERVTGEPLQSTSYLRYLREKFGALYDLN